MVAKERIHVRLAHAGRTLTVEAADTNWRVTTMTAWSPRLPAIVEDLAAASRTLRAAAAAAFGSP